MSGSLSAEAAAAGVFAPALADYDAVVLLRRDALPRAQLALSHAAAGGKRKSGAGDLLSRAGFPGDQEDAVQPAKAARAVLRSIPPSEPASLRRNRGLIGHLDESHGHLQVTCLTAGWPGSPPSPG